MNYLPATTWWEQVTFWWDDGNICFVQDQHPNFDFFFALPNWNNSLQIDYYYSSNPKDDHDSEPTSLYQGFTNIIPAKVIPIDHVVSEEMIRMGNANVGPTDNGWRTRWWQFLRWGELKGQIRNG